MKAFKIIMNIFGIIGASILSVLLVIALTAMPIVSAATSFIQGENIHKIISSVDFSEIIASEMDLGGSGQSVEGEMINQLMQSEMMEELVDLCVENIFESVDKNQVSVISPGDIEDIAKDHEDEIKDLIKEYVGDSIPLTEEVLDEMSDSLIQEYSVEIAEMLPTVEDLGLDKEILNVIMNLKNGTYFWIVFSIVAALTLIVMLCQVMRFKGFMWIGVDYLVASVFTLISFFAIKVIDLRTMFDLDISVSSVLDTIIGIISSEMLKCTGVIAGLGVVYIIIFIVGRKMWKKTLRKN